MSVVLICTIQNMLDHKYPRANKRSMNGTANARRRLSTILVYWLRFGNHPLNRNGRQGFLTKVKQLIDEQPVRPSKPTGFGDGKPACAHQSTVARKHADAFAGRFLKDKGPTGVLPLEGSTVTIADEGAAGSKHHFAFVLKLAPNYGELAKRDTYVLAAEKYTGLVSREHCQA